MVTFSSKKPAISPIAKGGASSDDSHANRKYKWDVKPGGSYVPTVLTCFLRLEMALK